jgi:hypothetical protein
MNFQRTVAPEALDHLDPRDPAAQRSRRDLARLHRVMGSAGLVARAWQSLVPVWQASAPLNVLELGAGDGSLLLGVARLLGPHWPPVNLTLLDRQRTVRPSMLRAYAELGWTARVEVADVLDWAQADSPCTRPAWDLISTALFLHHFEDATLQRLLGAIAARSRRFVACEPHRHWLPLVGSHLVGALGANAITRADAVLSVRAGFQGQELTQLWPGDEPAWATQEYPGGLFCHCFSAQRTEVLP